MPLSMTKIAFGCDSFRYLADRIALRGREAADGRMRMTTRYRPKRWQEMIGGSLYWILAHQIVGRSEIVAFEDAPDGRIYIVLDPRVIPVQPKPKRAHQGWRYLTPENAPKDFDGEIDDIAAIPANVLKELSRLALV
ncbi:MAG: DUF1489 domain-containing protein [Sphingomonadales bacterium]|nr:DUF1489 domain-containing protein [Sphingomonadales bacterium]